MLVGIGVLSLSGHKSFSLIHYLVAGIVVITVYVEYYSIFAGIGVWAHGLLLAAAFLIGYVQRHKIRMLWWTYCSRLYFWEGFFYVCFILLIAFFTSRGEFHTDTNI